VRRRLGKDFAETRNALIDGDCGRVDNVRRIVDEAEKQGKLDDD
jgi:hypothetical protein